MDEQLITQKDYKISVCIIERRRTDSNRTYKNR